MFTSCIILQTIHPTKIQSEDGTSYILFLIEASHDRVGQSRFFGFCRTHFCSDFPLNLYCFLPKYDQIVLNFIRFYKTVPNFTKVYKNLPNIPNLTKCLPNAYQISPSLYQICYKHSLVTISSCFNLRVSFPPNLNPQKFMIDNKLFFFQL